MATPLVDDVGRPQVPGVRPSRIVSLVPSVTELICALGAADRLAAVTRYCTHPPQVVTRLPKIGGTKNPRVDDVVNLKPDLVIMNSEENRRDDYDGLLAAGLNVWVSFPTTIAAAADGIERLASALGRPRAGATLAAEMRAALRDAGAVGLASVPVFCPIWRKPWMSFNRDTYADDLLRAAGGFSVCGAASEHYPIVDLDAVAHARPEIVLLPDEPYPFAARHRALPAELRDTPAVRHGRVYLIDGKALSWYGPRTPAALRYFASILKPLRR